MKTELVLQSTMFIELDKNEELEVDGGNPLLAALGAVGLGVASYFVYEFANEGVKRATGKTIPENGAYYAGKALSGIGSGLKAAGDFLTK